MVLTETVSRSSASPETLLSRIASGERSAEHQLVAQYWRGLLYVLNKRTKDPQLANDLAQDTFLTVLVKARNGEIHNPEAIGAFIRQVGINLFIAHYRKEKGHRTEGFEDIQIDFPCPQANTTEKVTHQQLVEIVLQVVRELPAERDREILKGFYLKNTPKEELCKSLNLSPEHFDRVLYRAKERLRQCLGAKLNVNLSEQGLSHILSISLILFGLNHLGEIRSDKFENQMRDYTFTTHFRNCEMQEIACSQEHKLTGFRDHTHVNHE